MKAALAYLEEVAKRVLFAILFLVGLGFVRWAVAVRALACGTFLLCQKDGVRARSPGVFRASQTLTFGRSRRRCDGATVTLSRASEHPEVERLGITLRIVIGHVINQFA